MKEFHLSSSENPQFDPQSLENPQTAESPLPVTTEPVVPGQTLSEPVALGQIAPQSFATLPARTPPENPIFTGWDVLLISGLSLLTLLVVELLTVVGARVFVYRHTSISVLAQRPILALIGEFLSYITIALYMVMLVEGKYRQPFGKAIQWNWRGKAMLGLFGLGVMTVSLDLLSRFLPMPKSTPFDQFFARPMDAYLIAVFAVSIGPLMEEIFFRGFLYPVLARRLGVAAGIFLTALPFGLVHYLQYRSWGAVLVITLVGVVLTGVRAATKSVSASFLVHVGYNATLMLLAAIATDGFRHMDKAFLLVH